MYFAKLLLWTAACPNGNSHPTAPNTPLGAQNVQEGMPPGSPVPSCSSATNVAAGMTASFISIQEVLRGWRFSTVSEWRLKGDMALPNSGFQGLSPAFPTPAGLWEQQKMLRVCDFGAGFRLLGHGEAQHPSAWEQLPPSTVSSTPTATN